MPPLPNPDGPRLFSRPLVDRCRMLILVCDSCKNHRNDPRGEALPRDGQDGLSAREKGVHRVRQRSSGASSKNTIDIELTAGHQELGPSSKASSASGNDSSLSVAIQSPGGPGPSNAPQDSERTGKECLHSERALRNGPADSHHSLPTREVAPHMGPSHGQAHHLAEVARDVTEGMQESLPNEPVENAGVVCSFCERRSEG